MATSTGSGRAASASGSGSGSGSTQTSSNGTALPNTPARRKGRTEQMSERQMQKVHSRLLMSERKVKQFSHNRTDSHDSLAGIAEVDPNNLLDPNGLIQTSTNGGDAIEEQRQGSTRETTEYFLKRNGADRNHHGSGTLNKSMNLGAGKGPDGVALARAAARGGFKGQAPVDSFLHESSFVFNPLTSRVPQPSPRKAPSSTHRFASINNSDKGKGKATSSNLNIPSQSEEVTQRAILFIEDPSSESIPLSSADEEIQEALMIEDLLFVLMGIEGQYIHFSEDYDPENPAKRLRGPDFIIDPDLNVPMKHSLERILPMAKSYISINAFVEMDSSLEYGTVTHALCAAIRDLLKDYELLIVQLEHQFLTSSDFSLQKFWCHVESTLLTLSLLNNLTMDIAAYTHSDILGDDDESSDGSFDSELDGASMASIERHRRAALGLDYIDGRLETEVEGGIVKGGEILTILWDRISRMGGNPSAHQLFLTLFHRASQPYVRILLGWITTGHLADTYDEFMVMEDPLVTRDALELVPTDDYWERRYTLRDETVLADRKRQQDERMDVIGILEQADEDSERGILTGGASIPGFLQPWKHKILLAGKYLNVVRECGIEIEKRDDEDRIGNDEDLVIMNDDSFFRRIEEAYQRANSTLLGLLLNEHDIVNRLRSLKHYFFFSQSDFFSSFLEQAHRELHKSVNPKKPRGTTHLRLQTHLGMVLASSSSAPYDDLYKEDIKVEMSDGTVYEELTRINETKGNIEAAKNFARKLQAKEKEEREKYNILEILTFDISVKFPVSLIISRKSITRWQFLHRCLLNLKVSEHGLSDMWAEHQTPFWKKPESDFSALEKWKYRVWRLRHRMMFFVQQVLAFYTSEVIEPNWMEFEEKLSKVKTVDQLMNDHTDLLNNCRTYCLLSHSDFVEMHSKLMGYIYVFRGNQGRFVDQLKLERSRWASMKLSGQAQATVKPEVAPAILDMISRLERNWDKAMKIYNDVVVLQSTTDTPAALPLSYRLQTTTL